ncbi:MAG: outer membrane beta-barrel family protein [Bacteroidota bacterium]
MTTKLKLIFCALFCVLTSSISAQKFSVSGKVVDANNAAVSFANAVLLRQSDSTFVKGTSTDNDGAFIINNVSTGRYILKISFIGYKNEFKPIELSDNLSLDVITIYEDSETLEQVDIIVRKPTVERAPDRLTFNVANTALSEGTIMQVLKSTPGVITSQESINIKSTPATVYINNRRVQLSSEELVQLLETSPASSIKSVEVITNPPASYDADSGAVVNIIMGKNLITGYRGAVFSNYTQGVFPRYNVGSSHFFKNEKINFNLTYSYTNRKINRGNDEIINYLDQSLNTDQVWRSDINRNTWSETHNTNLNFDYFINDKNTLSLTATGLYMPYFKYRINNNTVIRDENSDFLSRFTADNLSRDDKYNIGADLDYQLLFNDDSSINFNLHYTNYDYERLQNVFSTFFDMNDSFRDSSEFNTVANQNTEIRSAKVDYRLPIGDESSFQAGAKFSNIITESDITRIDIINGDDVINTENSDAFDYDEKVYAGYVNFDKEWESWSFNVGLRAEQTNVEGISETQNVTNTQDYFEWFPNVSISHQVSDNFSLYANYKRSIQRPNYTNLNPFSFFLNENALVSGNPNLLPTFQDHYVIGTSFLEYFTIEAYYINYDGAINEIPLQDNTTNIIAYTPVNIDKTVDFGFDFSVAFDATDRWSIYAVTSFYNVSEEVDFGNGFVEIDQWANYSILSNNLSLLKDNSLNANLTLTWSGKNLQGLGILEDRLISEFSISKTVFNKKGVITLSAEDLFNFQDFDTNIRYLNQFSSNFADVDNRYVKLGFTYKFGNTKLESNERGTQAEERERIKDFQ